MKFFMFVDLPGNPVAPNMPGLRRWRISGARILPSPAEAPYSSLPPSGMLVIRVPPARLMDQVPGPPFTQSFFPSVLNGDAPPLETQKFPSAMSLRICFSTVRSAIARRSCAFSFCRSVELLGLLHL
jgi:hypothetical protein